MSNIDFISRPTAAALTPEQIAAQRAAFNALPDHEKAAAYAKFDALRAATIALRQRMAEHQAQRAIARAQHGVQSTD